MARSKEMDLTTGNPFRSLLKFAIPVILGNLFQLFYTLADSVIVGKTLGADSLAAVGSTSIIIYFVFCFINGFTGGFGICLGQKCGAKDEKGMRKSVAVSALLSIAFTVVLTLICCLLSHQILRWMQIPADISGEAYDYMFVVLLGTGATVFYNMISNMLRALGDSKTPLYFLVFSSVLNIFLDILFIVPFHMGVAGAAWATILSQFLSAVLSLVVGLKNFPILHLHREDFTDLKDTAVLHLKTGFPMGFQMSVMCIGQLAMQSAVNRLGTSAIAGYTAANKVDQLSVLVDNAVGIALANYVAQNYGARLWDRIKTGVRSCFLMLTALNILMGALMLFGKNLVVPLFVDHPTAEIIAYSNDYLWMVAPFYILLGALMVYRTTIQSMGNTWAPFGACILELFARVFCALFVSMYFGYRAICFSTPFAWIMALLLLLPVYFLREIRRFPAE